jgi:hypothetical protein
VWAVGALGTTAIYTIATNTWSTGPTFPKTNSGEYYDAADGPAALLPDGNVLLPVSPGVFNAPSIFFEFDGSKLISVPTPKNAPSDPSFVYRLLVLPTGQVMATDGSSDVEIYTPTGSPAQGTVPTISKIKTKLVHGQSYKIAGIGFNGVSQAVAYGDDYQAATNYPIVRITNTKTGHVFYGRTTNPSSMAVANPKKVTATLAIPSTIETGKSTLEVIANGVPSAPESVTIK